MPKNEKPEEGQLEEVLAEGNPPAAEIQQTAEKEPQILSVGQMELEQLRREVAEYKEKYLRMLAESENSHKRLQKERKEMIQYALQNTIIDFLTPIDHMENALKHAKLMSDEVKQWAIGFDMILGQFKDVLANNGVAPFESAGASFDPHRHEAVHVVETEEFTPGTIVSEASRGYLMGERTIRPARVTVAKAPTKQPQTETPLNSAENTDAEPQT